MTLKPSVAWMEKYRPLDIDSMIWSSQEDKQIVQGWIERNKIDGNILLSGAAGTGKSTLAQILIRHFIKNQADLYKMKSRSVKEIDENIRPFVGRRANSSPFKIVYIEEFDRMSQDAQRELKDGYMEKYIDHCIFIACSNHPKKIENAVLTRFGYKFDFNAISDIQTVTGRIIHILQQEGVTPDEAKINDFVKQHYKVGMRELINLFQANFNAHKGTINFDQLEASANFDDNLVQIILEVMSILMTTKDSRTRRTCSVRPMNNTPITQQYTQFVTLVTNNAFDINYGFILERLYESFDYIPFRTIVGRYSQTLDGKKYPQFHLEACVGELMKCASEALL
ncbi:MAG: AAA family ATPase [Melioribacteraceae bacterium]|nr:AAA family ATPase [Melioribacteraceae bacterium]